MSDTSHFKQSKKEFFTILVTWVVFCIWVVGYSCLCGYGNESETITTVLGMPSWVVWGIAAPWLVATVFTVLFGMRFMKDQPLDQVEGEGEGDEIDREGSS